MKHDLIRKYARVWLVLTILIAVILLSTFWSSVNLPLPPPLSSRDRPPMIPPPQDIELFYILKTVFSTLNVTLLILLLATYLLMYIREKLEFTLWLAIISTALLLNALTSNPFVQWIFGFRAFGLGPFAMLPDIFTLIVLAILLYLTMKY